MPLLKASECIAVIARGDAQPVGPQPDFLAALRALANLVQLHELPVTIVGTSVLPAYSSALEAILTDVPKITSFVVPQRDAFSDAGFSDHLAGLDRSRLLLVGSGVEGAVSALALSALAEGYDVYLVVDAIGREMDLGDKIAIDRLMQAGVVPVTSAQVRFELGELRHAADMHGR